ncbi:hypothetical protein [Burkholderia multivorans]|uniref:hypothetical protein n=1 Tax=Burkholderia multivorans TaxID=87883 RepID=UPI0015E46EB3|nr:hypothetical protein [Burkholderia multivorans]
MTEKVPKDIADVAVAIASQLVDTAFALDEKHTMSDAAGELQDVADRLMDWIEKFSR